MTPVARWQLALAFVLLAAPAPDDGPADDDLLEPRETTLEQLFGSAFDPRWVLPDSDDWADVGVEDLPARALALSGARFAVRDPVREREDELSFAAAVDRLLAARGKPARVERALRALRRESPALWDDCGPMLEQLGRTATFDGGAWDPDDDEEDDGIFLGAVLDLARIDRRPWNDLDGTSALPQACILIEADLAAIKSAEGNYPEYRGDVGAAYVDLRPIEGSLVVGEDGRGRPFQGLRVLFEADLPFPFTTYDCDLRLLTRVRDDRLVVTDLHATNEDFHWFAGRDVYVPIETPDGAFVAMLVVRQFGFDLDGVPDGDADRQAATRSTLGNLRRRAERLYGDLGEPRVTRGALPAPSVKG